MLHRHQSRRPTETTLAAADDVVWRAATSCPTSDGMACLGTQWLAWERNALTGTLALWGSEGLKDFTVPFESVKPAFPRTLRCQAWRNV